MPAVRCVCDTPGVSFWHGHSSSAPVSPVTPVPPGESVRDAVGSSHWHRGSSWFWGPGLHPSLFLCGSRFKRVFFPCFGPCQTRWFGSKLPSERASAALPHSAQPLGDVGMVTAAGLRREHPPAQPAAGRRGRAETCYTHCSGSRLLSFPGT